MLNITNHEGGYVSPAQLVGTTVGISGELGLQIGSEHTAAISGSWSPLTATVRPLSLTVRVRITSTFDPMAYAYGEVLEIL